MSDGVLLQEMINYNLKTLGKKTVAEVLKEHNKEEEPGVITAQHRLALQQLINIYTKSKGIDINKEIEKEENRKQILGVISRVENRYIDKLLTEYELNIEKDKEKVA